MSDKKEKIQSDDTISPVVGLSKEEIEFLINKIQESTITGYQIPFAYNLLIKLVSILNNSQ